MCNACGVPVFSSACARGQCELACQAIPTFVIQSAVRCMRSVPAPRGVYTLQLDIPFEVRTSDVVSANVTQSNVFARCIVEHVGIFIHLREFICTSRSRRSPQATFPQFSEYMECHIV